MNAPNRYQAIGGVNVTARAIEAVIWGWHVAECLHLIRGTKCEPA